MIERNHRFGRLVFDRDAIVRAALRASSAQATAIEGVVPAVVGTSASVQDEAARRFSSAFYRALGDGLPINEAFRDGGDSVAVHGLTDVFHAGGDLTVRVVDASTAGT